MSFANNAASIGSTPWLTRIKAVSHNVLKSAERVHPAAGLVTIATASWLAGPAVAGWHSTPGTNTPVPGTANPAATIPAPAGGTASGGGAAVNPPVIPAPRPVTPLAGLVPVPVVPPVVVTGPAKLDQYAHAFSQLWQGGTQPAPVPVPPSPVVQAPHLSSAEKVDRWANAIGGAMRGDARAAPQGGNRSQPGSGQTGRSVSSVTAPHAGSGGGMARQGTPVQRQASGGARGPGAFRSNGGMGGFRPMPRGNFGGRFGGGGFGSFGGGGRGGGRR